MKRLHLFLEHAEAAGDLLHISGDVASADLETLETTRGTPFDGFQFRMGLSVVIACLFEDDLSRLAAVVGPLEVHVSR